MEKNTCLMEMMTLAGILTKYDFVGWLIFWLRAFLRKSFQIIETTFLVFSHWLQSPYYQT